MNVRQYLHRNGWNVECQTTASDHFMTVQIAFDNHGREDEVEFEIRAYDTEELTALFEIFCKEEKCSKTSVTGISVVRTADTMSKLFI